MVCWLAIISACIGLCSFVLLMVDLPSDVVAIALWFMLGAATTLSGLILGSVSLKRGVKRGSYLLARTAGLLLSIVACGLMAYLLLHVFVPEIRVLRRGTNIGAIGVSLFAYAEDHSGKLPVGATWCDMLVDGKYICGETLRFVVDGRREHGYTLNIEALGLWEELPRDMVLAFESSPVWNQVGGRELLVYDSNGGCCILFGDTSVAYVKDEKVVRLRWQKTAAVNSD